MKLSGTTLAKVLLVLVGLLGFSEIANAQLNVGAQIRPRFEFRNGFKTPLQNGDSPVGFVEQRSRIYLDFKKDKFRIHINAQDIRMWGATNQIYKTDPSLTNLFEAYAEYYFNPKFTMKMGRMDIVFNQERFFGGLDWASQGRSHDALTFSYTPNNQWYIYAGGAYNTNALEPTYLVNSFYANNNYKNMQFAWATYTTGSGNTQWNFLFQNDGRQSALDSTLNYRQTFGFGAKSKLTDQFSIDGLAYAQTGQNSVGVDIPFAYLLSLALTYQTDFMPITIGGDFLSGTSQNDTEDHSFDPLYGTNHKWYGYMDYFYVGNPHRQSPWGSAGLIDIYLKGAKKFGRHTVKLDLHEFMAPVSIYDGNQEEMDSHLGFEIDVTYAYQISDDIKLTAGYSQMFASETMDAIKVSPDPSGFNNWFYLMIDFTPLLYSSGK
ncbi:MAG: alginate export family protein [Schleiferiaceae bacterium]